MEEGQMKDIKLAKRMAAAALTLSLCLSCCAGGYGADTERDTPTDARRDMLTDTRGDKPADDQREVPADIREETRTDIQTDTETGQQGHAPFGEILAGPVELNSDSPCETVIIDGNEPVYDNMSLFEDEDGLYNDADAGGEAVPDAVATQSIGMCDGIDDETEFAAEITVPYMTEAAERGLTSEAADMTESNEPSGAEEGTEKDSTYYMYEKSMTLEELSLLPQNKAGSATEINGSRIPASVRGRSVRSMDQNPAMLWSASDYYVNEPDLHNVKKTDDFSLKYQVEFHASTDLDAGSVEIRIPEAFLEDRSGQGICPCQIGVPGGTPQSPCESLNSPFNWYRDGSDNTLVFFNYRPVSSGTNTAFQVLYDPVHIRDLTDGSEWSFTPQISVTTAGGDTHGRAMDTLGGSIDSYACLIGASADAFSDGSISCMPALYTSDQVRRVLGITLPSFLSGQEREWLFIVWEIDCQGQFNQPWTLEADADLSEERTLGSADSCIVGSVTRIKGSEGGNQGRTVSLYAADENSTSLFHLSSGDLGPDSGQGMFHLVTTAVTAVRKSSLKNNGSVLKLDASLTLTPEDGLDESTSYDASASWTFVDYTWKYAGDDVGITAWTGENASDGSVAYPGKNTSLSGWINEYQISRETGAMAGAVPMRIVSKCRGYSYTHELAGPSAGSYIPGSGYEVTTADDAVYLAGLGAGSGEAVRLLGPDDYYYSGVSVSIKDRGMDIYEDRVCAPMKDSECAGASRSADIYAMYAGSENWELAARCPWREDGNIAYTFTAEQLSKKVRRVKVVHRAADYESTCTIDVMLRIRPDSPAAGGLLEGADGGDMLFWKVEHLGSVLARSTGGASQRWFHDTRPDQYDEDSEPGIGELTMSLYGMYSMRANSFAELTSLKKHARALKTISRENDPSGGCIRMTCTIGAAEGYLIYSRSAADRIISSGADIPAPDRRRYVFYDLLPEGVMFDPSVPLKAGLVTGDADRSLVTPSLWNRRDVKVHIDPEHGVIGNWKNTGRTMVIIDVLIDLDAEQIPRMSGGMWMNGAGVEFGAYCPYRDLKKMKSMPNIAAVMPGEGQDNPLCQILGTDAETACDDGIVVPYTGEEKKDLEAFGADIDCDGVTGLRTVLYAYARSDSDTAVSLTDGISLTVRADRSKFTDWDRSAVAGPGDPYTYRIDVTNTSSQPVSEIVIAGHLERAAEEREAAESGREFDDVTWQGFLSEIDIQPLIMHSIAPVVWLNRDADAPLPGEGAPPDSVLNGGNGWVRLSEWSGDIKDARSYAVDVRSRSDGSAFSLEMGDSVNMLLHMTAPRIGEGEGEPPAEHAYHCTSFYSISPDEPDGDLVQSNAVEVTLKERSALIVEKELIRGEGEPEDGNKKDAFLFRLLRSGEAAGLCEYRLEEKGEDGEGNTVWNDDDSLHTTGRDGTFPLLSGQRAVFENEAGTDDLSAEEIRQAAFEEVLTEVRTRDGRVCRFENTRYPTLYLTKKVYGAPEGENLPDDAFKVRVTADGKSLAGTHYWSVDTDAGLVENQVTGEHVVDDQSCVLLHAGEVIALHPGPAGCSFEAAEDESCTGSGSNYAAVTVEKSGILPDDSCVVTLENAWRWKELVLRKEVLHRDISVCGESFSFRLWKMNGGTPASSFDPDNPETSASECSGVMGVMEGEEFCTDEHGCFRLPCAGKDVVLKHLEALGTYVVQETDLPGNYEAVNGGIVSVKMPLLGSRKYINVQNTWKLRSLEVSKAVMSGTHRNMTTVCTPGYPGIFRPKTSSVELFSCSDPDMAGFTVSFPDQVKLTGPERILVMNNGQIVDSFSGTIAAGEARSYSGYSQVSLLLWNMSQAVKDGFFFCFSPDIPDDSEAGPDMPGKVFRFRLETQDGSGTMVPRVRAPFTTSEGEELLTDENGCFTLAAGMSALFTDLDTEGCGWRVTEYPDPDCPQAYPPDGMPQEGRLGDGGADTSHALFINGEQCQGMIRKRFTYAPGDDAAREYLEAENAKGAASCMRAVILIETGNDNSGYAPMTGCVNVADASDGSLLRCELSDGKICLTGSQTVIISGVPSGTRWRASELDSGVITGDGVVYSILCTEPGTGIAAGGDPSDGVREVVFTNEIHSVRTSEELLVRKAYLQGKSGWNRVPDGALLVLCLEIFEAGEWRPAGGVSWIQISKGIPSSGGMKTTGSDGIIRLRKLPSSDQEYMEEYPILPVAVCDGRVKTQLYYSEHEACDGDMRIREVRELSDPAFGMLAGCEGNTFINENDMHTIVIEKQTDTDSSRSFSLKLVQRIGGAAYPGQFIPYTVRDSASMEIKDSSATDAQGLFTLRGGEQAVFSLPEGTQWEVTEKSSGGWKLISCNMENSLTDPVPEDGGMSFEVTPFRHNVTLTPELLLKPLRDPVSGLALDFTSENITIPHYVRDGDDVLEITKLSDGLFSGKNLRSVNISDGIVSIGDKAFYDCQSLTGIKLPGTLEEIGDSVFCFCSLQNLEIPSGVKKAGTDITAFCFRLKSIIINQKEEESPFSGYDWKTYTQTSVEFNG